MTNHKEILRLKNLGLSNAEIAWRDIIEVQRINTPKVIESKEEQGGVCYAQIR